jgi:hypothetical protein
MPSEKRIEEISSRFKAEMQEYVNEGFRASDCFPFVFQNLMESSGISARDRAELQQELAEWTQKIM